MMKKVLVVGATGSAGALVIEKLQKQGYFVYAASRSVEKKFQKSKTLIPLTLDLTKLSSEDIQKVLPNDLDYVINASGANGPDTKDFLELDAFGSIKLIKALKDSKIKHFVQLSAYGAGDETEVDVYGPIFREACITKIFSDYYLMDYTKFNWTIVQPSYFETGVKESETVGLATPQNFENPMSSGDVANVLISAITLPIDVTNHKIIKITKGDTPIADHYKETNPRVR
ncbi:NAD(P)H-binding protein [Mesoplasma whartonense]|uniref:NAD(P)H-binding protein n=1 Tax=Mesoplasma whartonense TaxID=2878854 RepID=UPI002022B410|nr:MULTISPECIES: NAD(P)H-binding protein [unclassified Mesoplasma]MCL8213032.1 hypothetical protein [Mesoplasma sp. JKS002661]MCL8216293.1 hypothetical protein [Mesoplasma sp. JKS002657]